MFCSLKHQYTEPMLHSVTSVGGTYKIPETAVSFSGGGFSNYFPTADFQEDVVSAYLSAIGDQNQGLYNASGRGYPDVAAFGVDFYVVADNDTEGVSGTSCSSPVFASVVSLLNDQLISAGKSSLGWLNPWLYSTASSAFTDITTGDNYACSDSTTGFNATTGWDPVSRFCTSISSMSLNNLRRSPAGALRTSRSCCRQLDCDTGCCLTSEFRTFKV